jgi:cysteinyl-tRNA synthetase
MHNEMLQVEGKKMSKSLGNFFTVRDLLDQGWPGEVIRMVYLGTHYSKPMDWTTEKAKQAEATLRKWRGLVAGIEPAPSPSALLLETLADDLNTAGAIAVLHALAHQGDAAGLKASAALLGLLEDALSGWEAPRHIGPAGKSAGSVDALALRIDRLVARRAEAKAAKDFNRADVLRNGLLAAGVIVTDTPQGPKWAFGDIVDATLLETLE